jgi:hypothetical protein
MPIPEDTCEMIPGRVFRDNDETTLYWINRDGKVVYRHWPLHGADVESFRFFRGSFAKDRKHCYCTKTRLAGGNGATFRALNYTYATDGEFVWTLGGKIKDVDAASFVVCDDGALDLGRGIRVPYGFGKDKGRVFYFDYNGKPNWVRKATPGSFVSLNDSYFGKDDNFIFCGAATLPGAKVEHWRKIGRYYSQDEARIYYFNRRVKGADYATFEVVPSADWELAKDAKHYYRNEAIVDAAEFAQLLGKT